MTQNLYSALLWGALGTLGLAAGLELLRRLRGKPSLARWASVTALASLALGVLAGASHFLLDHAPERLNPLSPADFFSEHPAAVVVPALALLVLGIGRIRGHS